MRALFVFLCAVLAVVNTATGDQTALTVYNNDLALVKETGSMRFESGRQTVSITDVASMIDPTSVSFKADDESVEIIEQNYRYDLVNSGKILERYVDNDISVWLEGDEYIQGKLLSASGDLVIQKQNGSIAVIGSDPIQRIEFPELPDGLITRPTLIWEMYSKREVETPTEVSYLTSGVSWHAEYTAVVNEDETALDLSAWVSIDNKSGATYKDAKLKLVAGDVQRVQPEQMPAPRMAKTMMMDAEAGFGGFEERGFFAYHLYELQEETTIRDKEMKQISLFDPATTPAKRYHVFEGWRNTKDVAVKVEFTNSDKHDLGIPLPAGKVRMYKRDKDGSLEFVGEDRIDHTPKNEKVKLTVGNAFDLVGERQVMDTRRVTDRVREETVEIKLRNRSEKDVEITAQERLWGDWEIIRKSHDFEKKNATTAEFTVKVPADGETIITYTVRRQ